MSVKLFNTVETTEMYEVWRGSNFIIETVDIDNVKKFISEHSTDLWRYYLIVYKTYGSEIFSNLEVWADNHNIWIGS